MTSCRVPTRIADPRDRRLECSPCTDEQIVSPAAQIGRQIAELVSEKDAVLLADVLEEFAVEEAAHPDIGLAARVVVFICPAGTEVRGGGVVVVGSSRSVAASDVAKFENEGYGRNDRANGTRSRLH